MDQEIEIINDEEIEYPSFYAIIPASVRYDKDLPSKAALMYGEITALSSRYGFCWAKNSYFAKLYDRDESTITKWLGMLIKKGHIKTFAMNIQQGSLRLIMLPETTREQVLEGLNVLATRKNACPGALKNDSPAHRIIACPIKYYKYLNTTSIEKESTKVDIAFSDENATRSSKDLPGTNKKLPRTFKYPEIDGAFDSIIEYWNSKYEESGKKITRHMSKTSETWNRISYYISTLVNGTYHRNFDLNPTYAEQNKINLDHMEKKYTLEEIKQIIDWYILSLDVRYGSQYKTKFPKSLADFLYNQTTHSSFFMATAVKGEPKLWCQKPIDQSVVNLYRKEVCYRTLSQEEERDLIRGVNFVVQRHQDYINLIGKFMTPYNFQEDKFYHTHIAFLRDRYIDSGVFTVSHIGGSSYWDKYKIWVISKHGKDYSLNPSREQIEAAKILHEKTKIEAEKKNAKEAEWQEAERIREERRQKRGLNKYQVGYAGLTAM
jgi:hypothetical protein